MLTIKCTLYHATWCGYCVKVVPQVKRLQKFLSVNPIIGDYNVSAQLIESKNIPSNVHISGFPTINITVSSGNSTIEYVYDKERTAKDILKDMLFVAPTKIISVDSN